jgi:TetR/AcrR family transcriptional repressor of nem operon
MRYPAAETEARHARILAEAARLFRAHGFGGVNVAEVMQAAGLTHGAFYAHFDSKDALAAAATEQAMGEMLTHLERARGANDAEAAFVAGYLDPAHRDAPGSGCAIAALGPEVARHPGARGPFTAALRRVLDAMADTFARRPAGHAARRDHARERQHALGVLATLVGALVLARAVDDPALSDEVLAAARRVLAGDASRRRPPADPRPDI